MVPAKKYYAVHKGRKTGVFDTWDQCKSMVYGFKGGKFKSFITKQDAENFVLYGDNPPVISPPPQESNVVEHDNGKTKHFALGIYGMVKTNPIYVEVYTDGCARGNGRVGAYGGIGVFYGDEDPRNVAEPLEGDRQTNQRAELCAVVRALQDTLDRTTGPKGIHIFTDSDYTIKCLTIWGKKWEQTGYRSASGPVKNSDLIKGARALIRQIEEEGKQAGYDQAVKFTHVRGHKGIYGNEMADRLANLGAEKGRLR